MLSIVSCTNEFEQQNAGELTPDILSIFLTDDKYKSIPIMLWEDKLLTFVEKYGYKKVDPSSERFVQLSRERGRMKFATECDASLVLIESERSGCFVFVYQYGSGCGASTGCVTNAWYCQFKFVGENEIC